MKGRWIICIGGLIGMAGCSMGPEADSVPLPTAGMADSSGIQLETLERGHLLYRRECGRCHELIPPDQVKTEDWHLVVPGMCWNAGLSEADEEAILKYVLVAKS